MCLLMNQLGMSGVFACHSIDTLTTLKSNYLDNNDRDQLWTQYEKKSPGLYLLEKLNLIGCGEQIGHIAMPKAAFAKLKQILILK